jgi:aminoglycoside phosphotransferase (APT) family kinase protein
MLEDQLDLAALQPYLSLHLPQVGRVQQLEKFSDGQSNPTYLLTATSGQYVLRRQPPGELLKSAHLCEDRGIIGSMFYLMSYEPGRIFWDPCLPELDKAERGEIYSEMNRVLAALHDVDVEAVGLGDFGRPGSYFERQVSRWSRQYRASEIEPIPAMDRLPADRVAAAESAARRWNGEPDPRRLSYR